MKLNFFKKDSLEIVAGSDTSGTYSPARNLNSPSSDLIIKSRKISSAPLIKKYTSLLINNILSSEGIKVEFKTDAINELWHEKQDSLDFLGRSFVEVQRDCLKRFTRDGEIIILPLSLDMGTTFKISVENSLALDYTNGIEFDDFGRPKKYVFDYSAIEVDGRFKNRRRQEIEADKVIHIFEVSSPDVFRGIPEIASAINPINLLEKHDEVYIKAASIQAAFNGHWEAESEAIKVLSKENRDRMTRISADIIHIIPKDFKFVPITSGGGLTNTNYSEIRKDVISDIADSLKLSYVVLTGDVERTSFSSMRAANIEATNLYREIRGYITKMIKSVIREWLTFEMLTSNDLRTDIDEEIKGIRFIYPAFLPIDDMKHTNSQVAQIEIGIKTRKEVIEERGGNYDETVKQFQQEQIDFNVSKD